MGTNQMKKKKKKKMINKMKLTRNKARVKISLGI